MFVNNKFFKITSEKRIMCNKIYYNESYLCGPVEFFKMNLEERKSVYVAFFEGICSLFIRKESDNNYIDETHHVS